MFCHISSSFVWTLRVFLLSLLPLWFAPAGLIYGGDPCLHVTGESNGCLVILTQL